MNSTAGSPTSSPPDLDARLFAAHAAGDGVALSALYEEAAEAAAARGDDERAGFFLTHAFIFALEDGLDRAAVLEARLREMGRV